MKNIVLPNRYNYKIELIFIGDDNYLFLMPENISYRIIGEIDDIIAIDPDGGPYIQIGDIIGGRRVLKIQQNKIITLSHEIVN